MSLIASRLAGRRVGPGSYLSIRMILAGFVFLWLPFRADRKTADILNRDVAYYRNLNPKDRKKFEKRVMSFMYGRKFSGEEGQPVTAELKVLTSACLVMITFGMPHPSMAQFPKVKFYPDAFYSPYGKAWHKGEVNPGKKYIALSAKHLLESFRNNDTQQHLGLHEMAHAVKLQNLMSSESYNFFFKKYFQRWKLMGHKKLEAVKKGQNTFLRDYAGTNDHEFFAVCVEQFFLDSSGFKKKLPNLYWEMCILLQQNPLCNSGEITNIRKLLHSLKYVNAESPEDEGDEQMAVSSMPSSYYLFSVLPWLMVIALFSFVLFLNLQTESNVALIIIAVLVFIIISLLFKSYHRFRFLENGIHFQTPLSIFHKGLFIPWNNTLYVSFRVKNGWVQKFKVIFFDGEILKSKETKCHLNPDESDRIRKLTEEKGVPVIN